MSTIVSSESPSTMHPGCPHYYRYYTRVFRKANDDEIDNKIYKTNNTHNIAGSRQKLRLRRSWMFSVTCVAIVRGRVPTILGILVRSCIAMNTYGFQAFRE